MHTHEKMMRRRGGRLAALRARFGEGHDAAFAGERFGRGPHRHGPGGPHGHDGPGGRRGKRVDSAELQLLVLGALAEAPQHGYQLIRGFAETSGGVWQPSPGVLYPLLTMLAEMGLIAEDANSEGGKRNYALTAEGIAELAGKSDALSALNARLAAFAEFANRTDRAPVRRAVMNMRAAIIERLGREGAADEIAFGIARVIDEATQTIERL